MDRIKWLKSAGRITLALLVLCLALPQVGKGAEDWKSMLSEECRKGLVLIGEGKSKEAREVFYTGVGNGDPDCMAFVGFAFLSVPDNLNIRKDGLQLINKAEESLMGRSLLGMAYLSGKFPELPQDKEKGLKYLNEFVDLGDLSMAIRLGGLYENGLYVEQDFQTAHSYYEKALANDKIYNLEHELPDVFVGVAQLLQDYEKDAVRADMKYSGKKVRITGDIISIASTPDGGACLVVGEQEDLNTVSCFFDNLEEIATLNKQEKVSVQGRVIKTETGLTVQDCWLAGTHF